MNRITKTPTVGQQLVYKDVQGNILPCEVVKVFAAVCKVKLLAGGLNNSLAGQTISAHVALLYTA